MLLKHHNFHSSPRQQEARNHPRRPTPDDAAASVHFLYLNRKLYLLHWTPTHAYGPALETILTLVVRLLNLNDKLREMVEHDERCG